MNATLAHEWISRLSAWSLETSLAALIPALVVLCLSHLRLISARWCALLAALLLARLLLPEVVPVSWRPAIDATLAPFQAFEAEDLSYQAGQPELLVETAPESQPGSLFSVNMFSVVWALGTAGVLTWLAFSWLQIRRLVASGRPANSKLASVLRDCARSEGLSNVPLLLAVPGLQSAAVFGWFNPRLLVPEGFDDKHTTAELRGIFLHELQHLKRADCAWTWLGLIACAVHWFNPLAWLLFRRFCADRELVCDEAVLHQMRADARRSYGEALIKTAELYAAPSPALLPSFSSNPAELKHRMKLIVNPASRSLLVHLVSAAVGIGIAAFAFTTAHADGEKEKSAVKEDADGKEEARKTGREEDGESKTTRDGEGKREGARDGEGARKEGARDGEERKSGPRDGETRKSGPRDGEGERRSTRDGDEAKGESRDDEDRKSAERDGESRKKGARDGEEEGARKGTRDGEGEGAKREASEGEGRKSAEREGGERMRESEREGGEKPATKAAGTAGQQMIIQVNAEGNVVNSKGDIIDIQMVRGRMKQIADENPDQSVILRADADTAYAKVLNVLDALKDAGLKDVKLEASQK